MWFDFPNQTSTLCKQKRATKRLKEKRASLTKYWYNIMKPFLELEGPDQVILTFATQYRPSIGPTYKKYLGPKNSMLLKPG